MIFCVLAGEAARAGFLRLGPFDFDSKLTVEGVYSSNVEQERPSQATESREDWFLVVGIDLKSHADISPNTTLNLETGFAVEKHFNRPDLDNSENPFGRIGLDTSTKFGRFTLDLHGLYERTSESKENTFFPGGQGKERDPRNEWEYGATLFYERNSLKLEASALVEGERHDKEVFQEGDQDVYTFDFRADWQPHEWGGLFYEVENKKTVYIHKEDEDDEDEYEVTEKFGLEGAIPVNLLRHPHITYEFGLESKHGKDDEDNDKWKPMHTVNVFDDFNLTPSLAMGFYAKYENKIAEDDITFTYGLTLDHQISRTAKQSFMAEREPTDTFGSTKETDKTTFEYGFVKDDLFIYNLSLMFDVRYEINVPLDQDDTETERKWTWEVELKHTRPLSRSLTREIKYEYDWERTNLEDEVLDEHRVTWSYFYTF